MKIKIVLISALLLCISFYVITHSFFTTKVVIENKITTASVKLNLHDNTNLDKRKLMPGDIIKSDIKVENKGSGDCYLRLKPIFTITKDEKTLESNVFEIYFDENILEKIGEYYYYKNSLKSNEITPRLFNGFKFILKSENKYQSAKINMKIEVQAVQSKNNGTSYKDAKGYGD